MRHFDSNEFERSSLSFCFFNFPLPLNFCCCCCWLIVFEQKTNAIQIVRIWNSFEFCCIVLRHKIINIIQYYHFFVEIIITKCFMFHFEKEKNCVPIVSVHYLNKKKLDGWLGGWHESWIHCKFILMWCQVVPFNARFFPGRS